MKRCTIISPPSPPTCHESGTMATVNSHVYLWQNINVGWRYNHSVIILRKFLHWQF